MNYVRGSMTAAETAKGVNHVWLNRPSTAQAVSEVERALEALVVQGLLEKHPLPGCAAVYRISQRRDS